MTSFVSVTIKRGRQILHSLWRKIATFLKMISVIVVPFVFLLVLWTRKSIADVEDSLERQPLRQVSEEGSSWNGEYVLNEATWPHPLAISSSSPLKKMDLSHLTETEKRYVQKRLPEMIARGERVSKACCRGGPPPKSERLWNNFMWELKHQPNIVYCPNFKVASTTMKMHLLVGVNYTPTDPKYLKLSAKKRETLRFSPKYGWTQTTANALFRMPDSVQERVEVFRSSLRTMVVRHPFARILSSFRYRMIVVRPDEDDRYDALRKIIIGRYRTNKYNESRFPTFSEFVNYIIENKDYIQEDRINLVDELFMTQQRSCDVCLTDPVLILKLETLKEDIKFLAYLANIEEIKEEIKFPYNVQHPTSDKGYIDHFATLSEQQINALYEVYKDDFLMFGYTMEEFFAQSP